MTKVGLSLNCFLEEKKKELMLQTAFVLQLLP